MGLDAYAKTLLGIEVSRVDFFMPTGTVRKCARCLKTAEKNEKFCSEDGTKISTVVSDEPTKVFASYAKKHRMSPEDIYNGMRDMFFDTGSFGLSPINAMQSGGDDKQPLALVIVLGRTESHRAGEERGVVLSRDLAEIGKLEKELLQKAKQLGIEGRPVKLFTCLYLSY